MYGFHKKVGLSDNSMRASERKNKSPSEYSNPFFKRGRPSLLWLIQKPKNPLGKGPGKGGTRVKQEDGNLDDDGEEGFDRENSAPPNHAPIENGTNMRNGRQPLLIGDGATGLPQQDFTGLQQELQEVRHQQDIIKSMLAQVRRDHEQLYGQAAAFQNLHDRHESSINAILTFLATVYNRSLEGQGGQNFTSMFSGAIPQDSKGMWWMWEMETMEIRKRATPTVKPSDPSEDNLYLSRAPRCRPQRHRLGEHQRFRPPPPLKVLGNYRKPGSQACKAKCHPTTCATKQLGTLPVFRKFSTRHLRHVHRKAHSSKQIMNKRVKYQRPTSCR